ncbi:MAG: ethanolamine utilization protein, partial [Pandoraea sp.]|nr:ethanolamine utilization protein [Pandoraea sp.]
MPGLSAAEVRKRNATDDMREIAIEHAEDAAIRDVMDPDALARSLPAPMVFVDLETTGGNALGDRITEIG